ncbi:MAG: LacI family DNA-binding transcriptional regulator [Verrucomicrobia bacterium]|nr:LacI family DNA-binding transcriptional regulator [Verrucomicrobiota bacterium]MCH8510274.1 LacI family transcriptional regulator [Kiritimatiellia bacterium]
MAKSNRRITLKDIAAATGVSPMTVSYALRNHPAVNAETGRRVREVAESMGYTPDPALSALVAYRSGKRPAASHGNLAWITDTPESRRKFAYFEEPVFRAASEQAGRLGYKLEIFRLGPEGYKAARLGRLFHNRGIQGALIAPLNHPRVLEGMNWERISAVSIGRSLRHPRLDHVTADHFEAGYRICAILRERGYRRIAFLSPSRTDDRVQHRFYASIRAAALDGERGWVPPFLIGENDAEVLARFLKKQRPDVVVSDDPAGLDLLRATGCDIPGELGFVATRIFGDDRTISGIRPAMAEIGERAISFLHMKMLVAERGVPDRVAGIVIQGHWQEGETLVTDVQEKGARH